MKNKRAIIILLHTVFWILTFLPYADKTNIEFVGSDLKYVIIIELYSLIIPFYLNYFFFSKLLERKKHIFYIGVIISFTALYILIAVVFEKNWILSETNYEWQYIHIIIGILFYILISAIFKSISVWFTNKEIEKDKIQAELNFLKIQINPHFLFNVLNNVYSLAYTNDKKAAPMIAKLSKILHYMLYDCNENKVFLDKEIELLKNFIALQQLRFDDHKNIDFYAEGINLNHKIAPLILLTLLENSFKHGDIDTNEKAWIQVECIVENSVLHYKVSNSISISDKSRHKNKGIGHLNTKKQLEIHYNKKHDLHFEKKEIEFIVNLTISL